MTTEVEIEMAIALKLSVRFISIKFKRKSTNKKIKNTEFKSFNNFRFIRISLQLSYE